MRARLEGTKNEYVFGEFRRAGTFSFQSGSSSTHSQCQYIAMLGIPFCEVAGTPGVGSLIWSFVVRV